MSSAGKKRSIMKTISWRVIATTDTFLIALLLTRSIEIGLGIVGIELITKMLLYYIHERGWANLEWGMEENTELDGH